MSWISEDVTFCLSDCDNKDCFRHPSNIHHHELLHSYAHMKGTPDCEMEQNKDTEEDESYIRGKVDGLVSFFVDEPCNYNGMDEFADEWCEKHCDEHTVWQCWEHAIREKWDIKQREIK